MYFLYSNIKLVKGSNRSILYDLHNLKYDLIPNELYYLFKKSNTLFYLESENSEYIDFLNKNEYIFELEKEEEVLFPSLDLSWDYPAELTNIIVHLTVLNLHILSVLAESNVKAIGIIINELNETSYNKILSIVNSRISKETSIQAIEIFILNGKDGNVFVKKLKDIQFISKVHISKLINGTHENIYAQKRVILNPPNISLYTELQSHHSYFNRKLYIDEHGNIKNAPSASDIYGNIKKIKTYKNLKEIIELEDFRKYWFVKKHECDVCKDCEFRYMCIDNRLPIKRKENEFFHLEECDYNPYISKWVYQKGYKALTECGIQSNKQGFKINRKKLNTINKELWGDD
jgi:hypothetical protein